MLILSLLLLIIGPVVDTSQPSVHAQGINLLSNPDFENTSSNASWVNSISAANWSAWKASGSPSIRLDSVDKYSGDYSVKFDAPSESRAAISQGIAVNANNSYRMTYWTKANQVEGYYGGRIRVNAFDSSSSLIGSFYSPNIKGTSDWQEVAFDFTTPTGTSSIKVELFMEMGTGTVWYDNLHLEEWVLAEAISVAPSVATISQGDTVNIQVNFTPSAASDQNVIWTSYNRDIATVDANGTVTAVGVGTTKVGVETHDGLYQAVSTITVTDLSLNGGFESNVNVGSNAWSTDDAPKYWAAWAASGSPVFAVDTTQFYGGNQSVSIQASSSSRGAIFENISASDNITYKLSAMVKTDQLTSQARIRVQYLQGTTNLGAQYSSSYTGTQDWQALELVFQTPQNTDSIRIELFLETGTGTVWFDDVQVQQWTSVQSIDIIPAAASVNEGQTIYLDTDIAPLDASNKEIIWSSSNENVATVNHGIVTGVSTGSVTITAASVDGSYTDTSTVTVNAYTADEYDSMRREWRRLLLGEEYYNPNDPQMVSIMKSLAETAMYNLNKMNREPNATYLWLSDSSTIDSGDIRQSYIKIYTMARAFVTEGSPEHGNPELYSAIMDGLEWLHANRYHDQSIDYGSGWMWSIGIPLVLNDITLLFYDYLTTSQVTNYMDAVNHFTPDPTQWNGAEAEGANRSNTSKIVAIRGVLVKDGTKIADARDALSKLFLYVTNSDGFYEDGSFIQHIDVPYTGSYGIILLNDLSMLLGYLYGTSWEVTDPNKENVYKWVKDAFEPIIYKGALMDMVRGRGIANPGVSDRVSGHQVMRTITHLSTFAPEPYASEFKSMVKSWIEEDTSMNHVSTLKDFRSIAAALDILNDSNVNARSALSLHKNFANMDRVVHVRPDYGFGLSMFSSRIQSYEDTNNENRRGWYTGYGMTYLYNNDMEHYSGDYWATVNPYRLPGTTVDTMHRADGSGEGNSANAWTGGSVLQELFGAAGMELDALDSTLTAKKSWFMFDDEIVALGTGISSADGRIIETIVENRKLNENGDNALLVNGQMKSSSLGWTETMSNVSMIHLTGTRSNSDIGYYFPDGAIVHGLREQRSGAWSNINYSQSKEPVSDNYMTLWFDHGANPSNDSYSYVLLPDYSGSEVSSYSNSPEITILSNNSFVQSVKENTLNITGANFWTNTIQTAGGITSNKKASVILRELSSHELEVAVSDPTMLNAGTIEIEIHKEGSYTISKDPRITILQHKPTLKFSVDVNGAQGKSIVANFKLAE